MEKPIYEQLDELYEAEWAKVEQLEGYQDYSKKMCIPILPTIYRNNGNNVGDENWWTDADVKKVMIFGRETGDKFSDLSPSEYDAQGLVADATEAYEKFLWETMEKHKKKKNKWFCYAFNYFKDNISNELNKKVAFLWNNLDLVGPKGKNKSGSLFKYSKRAYEIQMQFTTEVMPKMMELLKPDVVIFLTSNGTEDKDKNRDEVIMRNFGVKNDDFKKMADNCIGELAEIQNFHYATKAYRTNHPDPRSSNGIGLSETIMNIIIADIKENFKQQ